MTVTPPMDHGNMSRLVFGLTKATRPPRKMRQKCVPPSQLVVSVKSTIVLNVLTPTLVGPMLFVKHSTNDIWSFVEFTAIALLCNVLCREGVQCNVVYFGGLLRERVNLGLKLGYL